MWENMKRGNRKKTEEGKYIKRKRKDEGNKENQRVRKEEKRQEKCK